MRGPVSSGLVLSLLSVLLPTAPAHAQGGPSAAAPRIEWEVKHRFRLFRSEADFQRHVAATRNDGVLGAERRLEISSDGRGWPGDILERLGFDRGAGLVETFVGDRSRENYLSPPDHTGAIGLPCALPPNV